MFKKGLENTIITQFVNKLNTSKEEQKEKGGVFNMLGDALADDAKHKEGDYTLSKYKLVRRLGGMKGMRNKMIKAGYIKPKDKNKKSKPHPAAKKTNKADDMIDGPEVYKKPSNRYGGYGAPHKSVSTATAKKSGSNGSGGSQRKNMNISEHKELLKDQTFDDDDDREFR